MLNICSNRIGCLWWHSNKKTAFIYCDCICDSCTWNFKAFNWWITSKHVKCNASLSQMSFYHNHSSKTHLQLSFSAFVDIGSVWNIAQSNGTSSAAALSSEMTGSRPQPAHLQLHCEVSILFLLCPAVCILCATLKSNHGCSQNDGSYLNDMFVFLPPELWDL